MFSSRTEFASRCRVASRAAVEVGAVATDVMTDATIDVTIAEMTEGRTVIAIAAGRGRAEFFFCSTIVPLASTRWV